MANESLKVYEEKIQKRLDAFAADLMSIRAGRANPGILDRVMVDYYGTPTPVNQVAGVSVPEARSIMISPWDANLLPEIEKAILKSDIGITPTNDGKVIRLSFPILTEERRKELTKTVHKYGEETKVSVRGVRRDAMDEFKKMKKNGDITEDDLKDYESDVQKMTDNYIKKIDDMIAEKEKEIMVI